MCGLARSEGAHHCQPRAGMFPVDGASVCVLELYLLLWFSPPGDLLNEMAVYVTAELCRVLPTITCQKNIFEVVIVF